MPRRAERPHTETKRRLILASTSCASCRQPDGATPPHPAGHMLRRCWGLQYRGVRRRILAAAWRPLGSHTWAPLGPSAGSPGRTGRYASLERHELPGRVRVGSLNGDTAGGSPSAFRGQPGKCDGPLRYAMGDAQTGRRKSSRPGCMHLIWVRGCPPDPPGRQSGRSATGAGDVHAQGPASGLWATQYPSRPRGRLDHPRTAGGAPAGGSATGSAPSSGPGAGPGGPEGRDRTAAPWPGHRLGPRVRRAVHVLVGRPPAQICAPYFVFHLTRPHSTGPGNRHIRRGIPLLSLQIKLASLRITC